MKVGARRQQTFHQEGRFHEVAPVIEGSENGHHLSGGTIHEVRPSAVKAWRMLEESNNFGQPFDSLLTRNESAVGSDNKRSDAKTAGTGGDNTVVARNAFAGHARVGVGGLPVIAEGRFLHHGQQFFVAERAR